MELLIDSERNARRDRPLRFPAKRAFASVVLDVDSTVCGIDGIHWLASRRGDIVARRVAALAAQAEDGSMPPEQVFAEQIGIIRPRRPDVDELGRAYVASVAPGCAEVLAMLRRAGVHIVLASDSLRHALFPLATHLGVDSQDVYGVDIRFDAVGACTWVNRGSPLITPTGKRDFVEGLALDGPVLAVGNSRTDREIRRAVDMFAAFTGFVTRADVVQGADAAAASFVHVASIALNRVVSPSELRSRNLSIPLPLIPTEP